MSVLHTQQMYLSSMFSMRKALSVSGGRAECDLRIMPCSPPPPPKAGLKGLPPASKRSPPAPKKGSPPAPAISIVMHSAKGPTSGNLIATPVSGASLYTFVLTPEKGGKPITVTSTTPSVSATGLSPGASYDVVVTAKNPSGAPAVSSSEKLATPTLRQGSGGGRMCCRHASLRYSHAI